MPRRALVASPIFADLKLEPAATAKPIENRLVVAKFIYEDEDGDGLYTADFAAPAVAGQYEVITVLEYESVDLGTKELRLTTVVDPEGYVYEERDGRETRLPGAIVSLHWLNPETTKYELWPAADFQQRNPQVTDIRGTYSFLVPPGVYYLEVEMPGYPLHTGKPFVVEAGRGVHDKVALAPRFRWLDWFDWRAVLIGLLGLALVYNFYRDRINNRQPPITTKTKYV